MESFSYAKRRPNSLMTAASKRHRLPKTPNAPVIGCSAWVGGIIGHQGTQTEARRKSRWRVRLSCKMERCRCLMVLWWKSLRFGSPQHLKESGLKTLPLLLDPVAIALWRRRRQCIGLDLRQKLARWIVGRLLEKRSAPPLWPRYQISRQTLLHLREVMSGGAYAKQPNS